MPSQLPPFLMCARAHFDTCCLSPWWLLTGCKLQWIGINWTLLEHDGVFPACGHTWVFDLQLLWPFTLASNIGQLRLYKITAYGGFCLVLQGQCNSEPMKLRSSGQTPLILISHLFPTPQWSKKTYFSSLLNLLCSVFLLGSWHMQHHPNQRVHHHSAMKVHLKSLKRRKKSSDLSSLLWVAFTSPVLLHFQVDSQKVHWELHSVPSGVNISRSWVCNCGSSSMFWAVQLPVHISTETWDFALLLGLISALWSFSFLIHAFLSFDLVFLSGAGPMVVHLTWICQCWVEWCREKW